MNLILILLLLIGVGLTALGMFFGIKEWIKHTKLLNVIGVLLMIIGTNLACWPLIIWVFRFLLDLILTAILQMFA